MATTRYPPESRRPAASPRPKGRENNKDTLCRNVLIYGHCRYEDQGCAFNHDTNKSLSMQSQQPDVKPKNTSFNVDSPSFTPGGLVPTAKPSAISSHAAAAAHFTPRQASGTVTPTPTADLEYTLNPSKIKEFTPSYNPLQSIGVNGTHTDAAPHFDPFQMETVGQALPINNPYNPYAESADNGVYFQPQPTFSAPQQPVQYHHYAPVGPHKQDLLPYQRNYHAFFMGTKLQEELQKKSEATLQVMPNSQLPNVEHYHTLVALDTSHNKSAKVFGYPSWVYKATSSKNGNMYCLRRLEGYKLTNENTLRPTKEWKKIDSASVVSLREVFSTRAFGDSSLIFVTDYFPLSKTLLEQHFPVTNRYGNKISTAVPEPVLWSYIVQIASAIKTIHAANLAVMCMDPSKIIVTSENRVRLNACSIMDVVNADSEQRLPAALQQEDFVRFGKLILAVGTFNLLQDDLDPFRKRYSAELTQVVEWLLAPASTHKDIDEFMRGIAGHVMTSFDQSLHAMDGRTSELSRELENGRLFRLLAKLGTINERPEFNGNKDWSEQDGRYMLKLWRDYTFHQVDEQGHPVTDLAHIIRSLNHLDVGTDEKVRLSSRDGDTSFVVTYRELKKMVNAAWSDLQQPQKAKGKY